MAEAVTPPSNLGQSTPDPTLMTIDALRREIAMLESSINSKLDGLEKIEQERFRRIDSLMEHFENLRKEQKVDTKLAVDAALESQKEATAKMEVSVSDQLTSLRTNFETSIRGVQSNIADLKDRMTSAESVKQGQFDQRTETRQITAGQIAVVGIGITVVLAMLAIISFIN